MIIQRNINTKRQKNIKIRKKQKRTRRTKTDRNKLGEGKRGEGGGVARVK